MKHIEPFTIINRIYHLFCKEMDGTCKMQEHVEE